MQLPDWLSHDETWWKRTGGIAAAGVTVFIAMWIGFGGPGNTGALAISAAASQVASALLFAHHRKAGAGHARSIVQRMLAINGRATELVALIQGVQDQRSPEASKQQIRLALGEVNIHLSYIVEGSAQLIDDWENFDPETPRSMNWQSPQITRFHDPANDESEEAE